MLYVDYSGPDLNVDTECIFKMFTYLYFIYIPPKISTLQYYFKVTRHNMFKG